MHELVTRTDWNAMEQVNMKLKDKMEKTDLVRIK